MAVVVQTTWNDLAICQNRQLMPQAMAGAVETVIRCVFIRPFKKLVKIHIGMGCNGVAVNLAHIGVNGLGQTIGLLKGFENKLVAKALVSFGSTIQIPESEADIARWCNYYISIEVKSLSQRVDEKIFNFDENKPLFIYM